MIVLVQANVMLVGLDERGEVLQQLPVRVTAKKCGREAARSLKNEKFDSVISKWDLEDMRDGTFLRNLRAVKPYIPTVAFVQALNRSHEISARSIGVSAVLIQSCSDTLFIETVSNLLGLTGRKFAGKKLAGRKLAELTRNDSHRLKRPFMRDGIAK